MALREKTPKRRRPVRADRRSNPAAAASIGPKKIAAVQSAQTKLNDEPIRCVSPPCFLPEIED